MTRYGYLGPEGTFTQMALHSWSPAVGGDHRPFGSVDAALGALRAGEIDAAMVPIENSVEGGVSATLDALASGEPLVVTGEVLVPITFVLAAAPGMPLADVRAVGTHRLGPGPRLDGCASPGRPTSRPCPRRPPPRGCARPATRHTRQRSAPRWPRRTTASRCSPGTSATTGRR